MEEANLMSDSVTASTFIVTPEGELITFEEYQKTKHLTKKSEERNAEKRNSGLSFLHEFQHQAFSSDTIKNMLRNDDSGVVSKDLIANCPNFRLGGQFGSDRNGRNAQSNGKNSQSGSPNLENGIPGLQNGVSGLKNNVNNLQNNVSRIQNGVSNDEIRVSELLKELNDENLTTTQHNRAEEIHTDLLFQLSELTSFNTKSQKLTGQTEIDLLRHTNMYLTELHNEVSSLKKKLGGDIAN